MCGVGSAKQRISGIFSNSGNVKRTRNKNMYSVSDADVIEEIDQNEMDRILDKIAKNGYSSLTAHEKRLLFELSNKKN